MKARKKFLLGGAVILGVAAYLMATSIRADRRVLSHAHRALDKDLARSVVLRDRCEGRRARGAGLDHSRARRRDMTFHVTDGAQVVSRSYRGLPPDTFTDGVDVVLEGRLAHDGTFRATTVLAKCASRYENAPEKYRSVPGYTSAPASRALMILIGELSLWVALLMATWANDGGVRGRHYMRRAS